MISYGKVKYEGEAFLGDGTLYIRSVNSDDGFGYIYSELQNKNIDLKEFSKVEFSVDVKTIFTDSTDGKERRTIQSPSGYNMIGLMSADYFWISEAGDYLIVEAEPWTIGYSYHERHSAIKRHQWNTLKVVYTSKTSEFYINGQLIKRQLKSNRKVKI